MGADDEEELVGDVAGEDGGLWGLVHCGEVADWIGGG